MIIDQGKGNAFEAISNFKKLILMYGSPVISGIGPTQLVVVLDDGLTIQDLVSSDYTATVATILSYAFGDNAALDLQETLKRYPPEFSPGPWVPEVQTLEGLVGFVKLADDWHLYVDADGAINTVQRSVPQVARRYDLLAEFHLDGAAKRFAKSGYTGIVKFYEARVLSFGDLTREISVQPGEFRISSMRLELNNADGAMTVLRKSKAWLNRPLHFLFGDAALGEEDFEVVGTGRIDGWSGRAASFTVEATDVMMRKFEATLTPNNVVTKILFPALQDAETRELIPLVIGKVSSEQTTKVGAIKAQLVNEPQFQYVAAQGIVTIENVYVDEVLVAPAAYEISYMTFGSGATLGMATFITFLVSQGTATVTCDIDGLKDTGDGLTMHNPARIWKRVLLEHGFDAGDIDDASFLTAEIGMDIKQISGVFAETSKSATLRGLASQMAESFNLTTVITKGGRIGVVFPQAVSVVPNSLYLIDESQIVQGSFQMSGPERMASASDANFNFNWYSGEFEDRVFVENLLERVNYGEEQLRLDSDMRYVRSPTTAAIVLQDRLFFAQEGRIIVEFLGDPELYRQVDLGQDVRLTHFAGNFVEQVFRVVSLGLTVQGDTILSKLRLVDMVQQAAGELTEEWKTLMEEDFVFSQIESDVFHSVLGGTGMEIGMR